MRYPTEMNLNKLVLKIMSRFVLEKKIKSVVWDTKAVWIKDGTITWYDDEDEGSSVIIDKYRFNSRKAECFDLSLWIKNNFTKDDYIVLKLDIEGAEYEVLQKLYDDSTMEYINKLYCEIHGTKCGKNLEQSLSLIRLAKDFGHDIYTWSAKTAAARDEIAYDEQIIRRQHRIWNARRVCEILEQKEKFETIICAADHKVVEIMVKENKRNETFLFSRPLAGEMLHIGVHYEIVDQSNPADVVWRKDISSMSLEKENLKDLFCEVREYDTFKFIDNNHFDTDAADFRKPNAGMSAGD